MKIAIGSDHAGFALKEEVKRYLIGQDADVADRGTHGSDPADYPDAGAAVAGMVSSGECLRGVLICGSGIGMSIVANRFPGVRAALCLDVETARLSRRHNDANVLVLAGRKTDSATALSIVQTWMETAFEGGRHTRRLDKIRKIESGIRSEK